LPLAALNWLLHVALLRLLGLPLLLPQLVPLQLSLLLFLPPLLPLALLLPCPASARSAGARGCHLLLLPATHGRHMQSVPG
jgi:hypothetical protein